MNNRTEPSATSLLIRGIVLIVFGIIAIATPAVAGKSVVLVIGALLLIAGIVQLVSGIRAEGWRQKSPALILGVLTSLAGLAVLGHPFIGLAFLTMLLAIFFLTAGIWKIYTSFSYRPAQGWLGILVSGILTVVMGGLIWAQWPFSGLWAVGILVGVDLLISGISLIALWASLRHLRALVKEAVDGK